MEEPIQDAPGATRDPPAALGHVDATSGLSAEEAATRLRQVARILATGAIRAARAAKRDEGTDHRG